MFLKVLELFSGTESFSKEARKEGYECFTIDNDPSFNPSLVADILKLDIKDLPQNPKVIWASPPCQSHSRINNIRKEKDKRPIDMRLYELIERL